MLNAKRIATLVTDYLRARYRPSPSAIAIQRLIETLFYASLKTEEGRGVACTVVFVGSGFDRTDVSDLTTRLHRFRYVPLAMPVALTARSLAKFSQAAPPWAACIAVRLMNDELEICGLFDQEIHYQNALNREGEKRFFRPGVFQVEINGPAMLTVYHDRKLLARLSHDRLVTTFPDVLNEGPIATALLQYINKLERRARGHLRNLFARPDVDPFLVDAPRLWLNTLSRILLGIRRQHHGGAILLIASKPTKDLSISFPLHYDRLETILERHLVATARWQLARNTMRNDYAEATSLIPAALVQDRRGAFNESEDAKKAELGSTAFISSLAGVDGLILFSGGLQVAGFGVEIKRRKDPTLVLVARDAPARADRLTPLRLTDLGTRHRSMMRYCDIHAGSVGFVISQDGDVRAMTKTSAGLVVWENIQLQEIETVRQIARTKPAIRAIHRRRQQIETQLRFALQHEHLDQELGTERKLWLTRSGDPLKLSVRTKLSDGYDRLDLYFATDESVILERKWLQRVLRDGRIQVEETSRYFRWWRLIRMTHKTACFPQRSKITMDAVKAREVDLSELDEAETHPSLLVEQLEDAIRAVLHDKQGTSQLTFQTTDNRSRYSFIQNTSSPDGRLALGFGLAAPVVPWEELNGYCDLIFRREHYSAVSEDLAELIRNYVVDLETNRILSETQCHYIGTRNRYGRRRCETVWSTNNRFMVQFFHTRWSTAEGSVVHINRHKVEALEILPPIKNHAYQFLTRTKHRAFRRFGGDRFAVSLSCDRITDRGLIVFEVFGEIPDSGEDETTFSVLETFRIIKRRKGIELKFIDCTFAPIDY